MSAVGLCANCRHVQIIPNKRGSKFYLCLRANEDAGFAKYPRLPVLSCRGYESEAQSEHDPSEAFAKEADDV